MTTATVNPRMREGLGARGRRFSRPPHTPEPAPLTREQRLLDQTRGDPRVAYRPEHGVLPQWTRVAEERRDQRNRASSRPDVLKGRPVPAEGGRHRRHRRSRFRRPR